MALLQIMEGVTINTSQIEAIEKKGKFSCKVTVAGKVYDVDFPYETFLGAVQKADGNNAVFQRP